MAKVKISVYLCLIIALAFLTQHVVGLRTNPKDGGDHPPVSQALSYPQIPARSLDTLAPKPNLSTPRTTTPSSCSDFRDLHPGDYFYQSAHELMHRGLLSGYPDCTFRPYNPITRGKLAQILAEVAVYEDPISPTQHTFVDVPSSSSFWIYIERLARHASISGYADGTFRPDNYAIRGQLIKIVANTAAYNDPVPSDRQTFSDVTPGSPFWLYVERLALHSRSGYVDHTFRPYNPLTRGQLAKIVANASFLNGGHVGNLK